MRVAEGALWRRMGKGVPVGGLDGAALSEPEWGTTQGSGRSPLVGNVYGHDGRDRWCDTEGTPRLQGRAPLRRFGADFLLGCAREDDARRVLAVLGTRWGRFGRARHSDKTRRLPLWPPPKAQQQGNGPATCDFWGCTVSWRRTRHGHWRRWGQTRRARFRRATTSLSDGCRRHRHRSIKAPHAARSIRVRGHCNDVGVSGNLRSVRRLVEATQRAWYKWRCRRSQRQRLTWERCSDLLRQCPLPRPRSIVQLWGVSPRVTSAEEPDGGNLLVRLWRGAGTGNLPAYSTSPFSPPRRRRCAPAPRSATAGRAPLRRCWAPGAGKGKKSLFGCHLQQAI